MDKHIHAASTLTLVFIFLLSHTTNLVSAVKDPWDDLPVPSDLSLAFRKHLQACGDVLTKNCGLEIYNHVLGMGKVGPFCCKKLLQMGEQCNNDMAYALGRFDKYKKVAMVIRSKSSRMFSQCAHPSIY